MNYQPLIYAAVAAAIVFVLAAVMRRISAGLIGGILVFAAVYVGLLFLPRRPINVAEPGGEERPPANLYGQTEVARLTPATVARQTPKQAPRDGFVTSERCQECHAQNHATWHASYHRSMTQLATPQTVFGNFDDVQVRYEGRDYHLRKKDDEFWVTMDDPDTPFARRTIERRVVLVTGSHHMQIYWYLMPGLARTLGQVPVHYYKELEQWVPADATMLTPPRKPGEPFASNSGRWNMLCMQCHATHSRTLPQSDTPPPIFDSQVAEFGISCEACHGPGRDHIDFHRSPPGPDDQDPIVNPAKLSSQRSAQVCGACHSYTIEATNELAVWEMSNGKRYRPGDELHETHPLVQHNAKTADFLRRTGVVQNEQDVEKFMSERFWSDGVAMASGREYNALHGSKCFEKISCVSCHQMHQASDDSRSRKEWADDQLQPGMQTNAACVGCHEKNSQQVVYASRQHTHHAEASSGSLCINCHMPHTSYALLKTSRNHKIESPSVQTSLTTGRPNACNLCHLDKTLDWTASYLDEWYKTPRPKLSEEQKSVAASVLWALTGNAGQRAITAWNLGWGPAVAASHGEAWIDPVLAVLLEDPYPAVRMVAARALQQRTGQQDLEYNYVGEAPGERRSAIDQALTTWRKRKRKKLDHGEAVLVDADGQSQQERIKQLLGQRDDRPFKVLE